MPARKKVLVGQFVRSSLYANIEEMEEWLNEQYQHSGTLLAQGAAQLAQDETNLAVAVADEGLNAGRKVRFVKGLEQELALISALALTVTVTRGVRAAHAQGTAVLDERGEQVGVLSAAMNNQAATLTFAMTAVAKGFAVGARLTIDEEVLAVTAVSSAITFARPAGNKALAVPFQIRDDNGPYALAYDLDIAEKVAFVLTDEN